MAIYNGLQKVSLSGIAKVYVGRQLVYQKSSTPTLSSISLSGTYPTTFNLNDSFSFAGGTVTATYSDSSTANVTNSATFSGYDMTVAGNYTVTVSYTEGGVTKNATYTIIVSAVPTPGEVEVNTLISDLASHYSWVNATQYNGFYLQYSPSNLIWTQGTGSGSQASPKYYSTDQSLRIYCTTSNYGTWVMSKTGYTFKKIKLKATFSTTTGSLWVNEGTSESNPQMLISNGDGTYEATLTGTYDRITIYNRKNDGSMANGNARITEVWVTIQEDS